MCAINSRSFRRFIGVASRLLPCIYADLYTFRICKHTMRKIIQLSYSNQRFCSIHLAFNVFAIECHLIMRFTYGAVINYFDYNTAYLVVAAMKLKLFFTST